MLEYVLLRVYRGAMLLTNKFLNSFGYLSRLICEYLSKSQGRDT
jgi:hypothetical protein